MFTADRENGGTSIDLNKNIRWKKSLIQHWFYIRIYCDTCYKVGRGNIYPSLPPPLSLKNKVEK